MTEHCTSYIGIERKVTRYITWYSVQQAQSKSVLVHKRKASSFFLQITYIPHHAFVAPDGMFGLGGASFACPSCEFWKFLKMVGKMTDCEATSDEAPERQLDEHSP